MGDISAASGLVEREARLFEAGDYPDKGLSVTEDDLERMAAGFSNPVPIHLEHRPGPLRFGWLTKVWRKGGALFGKLAFTGAAWELMKESGAKALSLGLCRKDLKIEEVSIVGSPRVAGAQVFSASDVQVPFDLALPDEEAPGSDDAVRLRREMAERDARDEVRAFAACGKIAPGAAAAALALLSNRESPLEFGGGEALSVADAFRRFLEAQPPVVIFGETAAAATGAERHFGDEERRVFAMLGISESDVAAALGESDGGKEKS